jgi:hypothetical protein
LPIEHDAYPAHAEALDLVEGLRAQRVVLGKQLAWSLEDRELRAARRGAGRQGKGRGEGGEENERAKGHHIGNLTPGARVAECDDHHTRTDR